MKPYCGNEKPFVYAAFTGGDSPQALSVLQKAGGDGISFWYSERFSPREILRIEAAGSCILFISRRSMADERVRRCIECAVGFNKKILCIYLERALMSPGLQLLLNSQQSLARDDFTDEEAFAEKLKSAEVFSGLHVTAAQKRFAKYRALAMALIPLAAAAVLYFAVVSPLLIAPMALAAGGSLSTLGFGNLSLAELARVEELYVVGGRSFDQWACASYSDPTGETVYVNETDNYLPTGDIGDISDLALLRNAKAIAFEANQISDITPLYTLKTLEYLTLNCNPIKSVDGIEALQSLIGVSLSDTEVSDISPLFEISSLRFISIDNTYVGSLEGIQKLKRLGFLHMANTNVTDLSPLNEIDFSYVTDTDGFSFEAYESLIEDFSPLARIPKFDELLVNVERADSLLPYIEGKRVRILCMGGSDLKTVAPLTTIEGLEDLTLAGTYGLTSLEGIEQLTELQTIVLIHCPGIEDFTPLLGLPGLGCLIVSPDMRERVSGQLDGAAFEIRYEEEGV